MEKVNILSHFFEKQNSVTIIRGKKAYDIYKCQMCGLIGKRFSLTDEISVTRNKVSCRYFKEKQKEQRECLKIKIIHQYPCDQFGFELGKIYERVSCPEDMKDKFSDEIWIFCEQRKEPVRLLTGEYKLINN